MRKVLYVLAALVIVVGLSQFVFPDWWMERVSGWADARWFALLGLPALVFGALLILGALLNLMALRGFFLVLGLLTCVTGGVMLANPALMRDLIYALYLNRSGGSQVVLTRMAGLVRMAVGLAMLYALITAPRREPEPPPGPIDA
jgi:hypothetical protein